MGYIPFGEQTPHENTVSLEYLNSVYQQQMQDQQVKREYNSPFDESFTVVQDPFAQYFATQQSLGGLYQDKSYRSYQYPLDTLLKESKQKFADSGDVLPLDDEYLSASLSSPSVSVSPGEVSTPLLTPSSKKTCKRTYAKAVCKSETVFSCPECPSKFRVKGYLTRHMKKHKEVKEFKCPFYDIDRKCHSTGEFSRKDTFKTHLRAVHFVYPVGVCKENRANSPGRCGGCYKEFNSNHEWLKDHIETDACEAVRAQ